MTLYVARQDDPARHQGVVVRLHETVFAPPPDAVRDHRLGRLSATAFRSLYLGYSRDTTLLANLTRPLPVWGAVG